MRIPGILLFVLMSIWAAADQVHLSPQFRTVFILPMAKSMDQHLASRLTSGRVLSVVLQPSSADAVLTESLDDEFWMWLDYNYPALAGIASGYHGASFPAGYRSTPKYRGTVFLVDPRRRLVLWSTYEMPKDLSPSALDHCATRITNQLRMAFGKK